ncbi:MAG: protein phosphatase 2C domain-containing protein [Ruminococcus sp.]|nr:protein phosphatase 2C domain-containing protein [Ruminococcus sp.]
MWITNKVAVQGRGHISENIPCQDKVFTIEEPHISVIALADGAGSQRLSHIGAETVCRTTAEFFRTHCNRFISDNLDELKTELYRTLITALEEKSLENDCDSIKELASTLLCLAVYKNKVITAHIGDGIMAERSNGFLSVLSDADNGEFSNQTTFVTSNTAMDHLRINVTSLNPDTDAFFIMSDGSMDSLYNPMKKQLSVALNSFADMGMKFPSQYINDELRKFFEESIRKRTLDDCSLCALIRKKEYDLSCLRPNQIKIIDYLRNNSEPINVNALAARLYRRKHFRNFIRDIRQLAEKDCLSFENNTVSLI